MVHSILPQPFGKLKIGEDKLRGIKPGRSRDLYRTFTVICVICEICGLSKRHFSTHVTAPYGIKVVSAGEFLADWRDKL